MTWETLPCCCGPGQCCPCNPFYGGTTAWRVKWSGLVSASPNLDCSCVAQNAVDLGNGFGEASMLVSSHQSTRGEYVATWVNTTNVLSPSFCTLTGFTEDPDLNPKILAQDYFVQLPNGQCGPFPGRTRYVAGSWRVRMTLSPPIFPCPTNNLTVPRPWIVTAGVQGIANFVFRGSTSCTSPGPFALDLQASVVNAVQLPSPSGSFDCASTPAGVLSWNAGTVSVA